MSRRWFQGGEDTYEQRRLVVLPPIVRRLVCPQDAYALEYTWMVYCVLVRLTYLNIYIYS